MKNRTIIITIVTLLLGVGTGFYGGIQYQKSKGVSFPRGQFQEGQTRVNGLPARNGNVQEGRPVSGEIISIDDNSVTIKTQDNSNKIIIFSDSTKISKTSEATSSDLKVGEEVIVTGNEGSNGMFTAQTIFLGRNIFQGTPEEKPSNRN